MICNKCHILTVCREWNREQETSRRKRRQPKLRTALLKTFYRPSMVDAFLVFLFILIK